jgi:very-short-patch-repair endonuclease
MHKRTTPLIFGRAKQLHRNMTPAEIKLWAQLRAHRTRNVHFRNQHAIGSYIVDFCARVKDLSSSWTEASIWNRPTTTRSAQNI